MSPASHGNKSRDYEMMHHAHIAPTQILLCSFLLLLLLYSTSFPTCYIGGGQLQFNVNSQAMAISGSETPSQASPPTPKATTTINTPPLIEVETADCASCGFTEECTPAYILRIREPYQGRWICGLCIQAVKDEVLRSDRRISTEEALNRHISFCKKFRSSDPWKETENPISAMGKLIRRSLDSPRALRSNSSSALQGIDAVTSITTPALVRSESCFSSISS